MFVLRFLTFVAVPKTGANIAKPDEPEILKFKRLKDVRKENKIQTLAPQTVKMTL